MSHSNYKEKCNREHKP